MENLINAIYLRFIEREFKNFCPISALMCRKTREAIFINWLQIRAYDIYYPKVKNNILCFWLSLITATCLRCCIVKLIYAVFPNLVFVFREFVNRYLIEHTKITDQKQFSYIFTY